MGVVTPRRYDNTTDLFSRALAPSGSPRLVSHLLVGYGHAALAPAESHANLPQTHAQADAAALQRFSSAVPARME